MNYKTYEVKVCENGGKFWYFNGKYHNEDGPACEYTNGKKEWFLNGKLHRRDGPAIEYANGDKSWYLDGKLHREDGPAYECKSGYKEWYLNGKAYFEEDWQQKVNKLKNTCNGRLVEIDGKKYKLVEVE